MNKNQSSQLDAGSVLTFEDIFQDEKPSKSVLNNTEDLVLDSPVEEVQEVLTVDDVEKVDISNEVEVKNTENSIDETVTVEEEKDKDLVVAQPQDFKNILINLMDMGTIDKFDTITIDDVETALVDTDIDADLMTQIIANQIANKIEALESNSVSTKGLSELTKSVISIDKANGNVSEALKLIERVNTPLSQFDLKTTKGQSDLILTYLRSSGQDEKTAEDLLNLYTEKQILESKALEFKANVEDRLNKELARMEQKAIQDESERASQLKEFKSNVKKSLTENFKLSESTISKLSDAVAKNRVEKGFSFEIDDLFRMKRADPKEAAELILFLTNKEEYIKQVTEKAVTTNNLETIKKIHLTRKGNSGFSNGKENKNERGVDIDLFPN